MHLKKNNDYKWDPYFFRKSLLLFSAGYLLCVIVGTVNFVNNHVMINVFMTVLFLPAVGLFWGMTGKAVAYQFKKGIFVNCLVSTGVLYLFVFIFGFLIENAAKYLFLNRLPAFSRQELYSQTVLFNADIPGFTLLLTAGYYVVFYIKIRKNARA